MFSALFAWELRSLRERPHLAVLTGILVMPVVFPSGFWFGSPWIMPLYVISLVTGYRLILPGGQGADEAAEAHYLLSRPLSRLHWFMARLSSAKVSALLLWIFLIPYSFLIRGLIHGWFERYFGAKLDPPELLDGFYRTATPGWCWAWLLSLIFCVMGSLLAMLRQLQGGQKNPSLRTLAVLSPLGIFFASLIWAWMKRYGSRVEAPTDATVAFLDLDQPWLVLSVSMALLIAYLLLCLRRLGRWDQGT